MKLAVKFLLFLLVLLALWIAHERYLYQELRVAFGGYEIAPPISIALVALATAALAIYVALKIGGFILFLPGKLRRRRAENQMKKRAETLLAGLRAMAMGDADSQEKHFGRAADMGIETVADCFNRRRRRRRFPPRRQKRQARKAFAAGAGRRRRIRR